MLGEGAWDPVERTAHPMGCAAGDDAGPGPIGPVGTTGHTRSYIGGHVDGRVEGVRRSPTGRVPQWVLDEATGRAVAPAQGWRTWEPVTPRRPRRVPAFLVVALVVLGSLGAAWLVGPPLTGAETVAAAPGWPTPGVDAEQVPLGSPPAGVPEGPHVFVATQDDGSTPVAWDPCRTVHYVVRPDHAPPGGDVVLADAFARLTEVTGLQFVADGPTDEADDSGREPFQPDRYGDRWAPVLVTWQTEEENPDFLTDTVGMAGSLPVSVSDGPLVFVTGVVQLDAAWFADALATTEGTTAARAVVLHELGHLVGLGHVGAPDQLMHPAGAGPVDFAAGDLQGLAALGRGECEPAL